MAGVPRFGSAQPFWHKRLKWHEGSKLVSRMPGPRYHYLSAQLCVIHAAKTAQSGVAVLVGAYFFSTRSFLPLVAIGDYRYSRGCNDKVHEVRGRLVEMRGKRLSSILPLDRASH